MKQLTNTFLTIFFLILFINAWSQKFTLESIKSYPFPTELTASATGSKIAWAFDEGGRRNIYAAQGPDFAPRKLTNYNNDDGQEITSLSVSDDGKWVVFVRGGDHGSNWDEELPVNPAFNTAPPKVQIWSIPFAGGEPKMLADGDSPVLSPKSDRLVFLKGGQVWGVPVDGSAEAKNLFTTRGTNTSLEWSPNGSRLVFVSDRGDHSLVGVFINAATPINWLAPSFSNDFSPRWSPEGDRIVFARRPGPGGAPDSILTRHPLPWSLWVADINSGKAIQIWKSPATLAGSLPTTHGSINLHWAANERIAFLSYQDGWPHLYSVSLQGGEPLLLTSGGFMTEYIRLSPDRKWLVFCCNTGPDKNDIDRRHVARVPVDKAALEVLTPGTGLEWTPVVTGDGSNVAYISATPQQPPLPAVMSFAKGAQKVLAQDLVPAQFPQNQLVTPKPVIFKSPDGFEIHGQLFEPVGSPAKRPAIVYVHGGPPRQMLLGWHYSDYYSNAYAVNQYLTSLGFEVLSVNYRLGIGYGFEFHQPKHAGYTGASEYTDIRAAGVWLSNQPQVDVSRIGIYGGSYGGYLTALALGRDSKLFAAGVDIHGVHDMSSWPRDLLSRDRYERAPDADKALQVAWESSPVSSVATWTSPVLIIHADDDRNVRFHQSTDLVRRLETKGVPLETFVIVDDTHHFFKHDNIMKVDAAIVDFLKRKLGK